MAIEDFTPGGATYPFHINANTATALPITYPLVGTVVYTTTSTTITGGVTAAFTPASTSGMRQGQKLKLVNGATMETCIISQIVGGVVTATAPFANSYSGTTTVLSTTGSFLGKVEINATGSGGILTLYNGHPSDNPAGQAIATITIASAEQNRPYDCYIEHGLYYTLTGATSPDITVTYKDDPIRR